MVGADGRADAGAVDDCVDCTTTKGLQHVVGSFNLLTHANKTMPSDAQTHTISCHSARHHADDATCTNVHQRVQIGQASDSIARCQIHHEARRVLGNDRLWTQAKVRDRAHSHSQQQQQQQQTCSERGTFTATSQPGSRTCSGLVTLAGANLAPIDAAMAAPGQITKGNDRHSSATSHATAPGAMPHSMAPLVRHPWNNTQKPDAPRQIDCETRTGNGARERHEWRHVKGMYHRCPEGPR